MPDLRLVPDRPNDEPCRVVIVNTPGRSWTVEPGDVVTFGRDRGSTVVLPDDRHISRRAGSLHVLDDFVLVRNTSTTKPIVLRPAVGEDRIIEPGGATASLPWQEFSIVIGGAADLAVVLDVDVRGLLGPVEATSVQSPPIAPTLTSPVEISPAQRRVLAALCAPLLTSSGPHAAPATYAQVADRLDLRPQYVRNVIRTLREKLSGHGVPGLVAEHGEAPSDDYRWALARWAIRNRWITMDDVAALPGSHETPSTAWRGTSSTAPPRPSDAY